MSEEAKPVDTTTTSTTTATEEPEAKKQKTTAEEEAKEEDKTSTMTETAETKVTTTPESPDSEWPEAWYMMEDGTYEDQKERNRLTPNKATSVAELRELGIAYWKMDAENFSYPVKAIPWDPKDATDPKLKAIRDDRECKYNTTIVQQSCVVCLVSCVVCGYLLISSMNITK